jgi:hypothetical protein
MVYYKPIWNWPFSSLVKHAMNKGRNASAPTNTNDPVALVFGLTLPNPAIILVYQPLSQYAINHRTPTAHYAPSHPRPSFLPPALNER